MRCFEVDEAHPKFGDIISATVRKDGGGWGVGGEGINALYQDQ